MQRLAPAESPSDNPAAIAGVLALLASELEQAGMALRRCHGHQDLAELIRLRPDIGLIMYNNLAVGVGEKLQRLDDSLGDRLPRTGNVQTLVVK